ncbi:hypothetical protein ACFV3R_25295 [Streptomyces sp. NPDC059740]|uniref:hypothetical protein n=1 Tax=Streptomyces sp. NPDC059740 TaxID=3346926 RepID=UPI003666FFC4
MGDVDGGAGLEGGGGDGEGAGEEFGEAVSAVVLDGEGVLGLADVVDAVGRVGPHAVGAVAVEHGFNGGDVGGVAAEEAVGAEVPHVAGLGYGVGGGLGEGVGVGEGFGFFGDVEESVDVFLGVAGAFV